MDVAASVSIIIAIVGWIFAALSRSVARRSRFLLALQLLADELLACDSRMDQMLREGRANPSVWPHYRLPVLNRDSCWGQVLSLSDVGSVGLSGLLGQISAVYREIDLINQCLDVGVATGPESWPRILTGNVLPLIPPARTALGRVRSTLDSEIGHLGVVRE